MENTNQTTEEIITSNDSALSGFEDHKDNNCNESRTTECIEISQNNSVTSCSNTQLEDSNSIHDHSKSCPSPHFENNDLVSYPTIQSSDIQSDNDPVDVKSCIKKCYVLIPPLPSKYLPKVTKTEKFVTEDEIAESLKKKEEIDSLEGSYFSGSISQISSLKASKIDSTLDALMAKKNLLINSIKRMLTTNDDSTSNSGIENTLNDSTVSTTDVTCVSAKSSNIVTSTPFRESKPPAARFLKNWKPSFLNEDFLVLDEIVGSEEEEKNNDYEKAIDSLREVLQDTEVDTTSKLDSYSHMLDTLKEQDDKKFHHMISSIALDRETFDEVLEITSFSADNDISKTSKDSIIWSDSQNNTVIEINDSKSNEDAINSSTEKNTTVISTSLENLPNLNVAENDHKIILEAQSPKTKTSNEIIEENIPRENDQVFTIDSDDNLEINIEEEDLLLASDDDGKMPEDSKKESIAPIAKKELDFFVSTDPDENKDNNDPNWSVFRNIENDYDRYKVVQARWKNLEIPNPKKDLTCRCKKSIFSNNTRSTLYKNNSRKRPHSPDYFPRNAKKPKNEMCSVVFDRNISKLLREVENKRFNLEKEQQEALTHLAEIQEMEKMILQRNQRSKFEWKKLEEKHFKETEECIREYRRRGTKIMDEAQAELGALRKASEEVRQFHEFYPTDGTKNGKQSLMSLTESEVEEILEVEEMVLSFTTFYNA